MQQTLAAQDATNVGNLCVPLTADHGSHGGSVMPTVETARVAQHREGDLLEPERVRPCVDISILANIPSEGTARDSTQ